MAEHGFTPGPWTCEDRCDGGYVREATPWDETGGIKRRKAVALVRVTGRTTEQNAANARLIAASPTLLEALERFVANYTGMETGDGEPCPDLAFARAAITLATGKDA